MEELASNELLLAIVPEFAGFGKVCNGKKRCFR